MEELQKGRKLIMDDFSEIDPYAHLPLGKRILRKYFMLPPAIHPQSKLMIGLVALQTLAFLYNAWAIPLRFCFHLYQNDDNAINWMILDYGMDAIYLLDTVVFRTRLMFLDK